MIMTFFIIYCVKNKNYSDAQKDKFYQLFDIHPSVPFNFAIIELGKIIQISLYFLGMIVETKCDDGLLCDETLTAIRRFYTTMSSYDTEVYIFLLIFFFFKVL